jgi:CO dehydrogenase/acetyl-CoA synthase beta subunit
MTNTLKSLLDKAISDKSICIINNGHELVHGTMHFSQRSDMWIVGKVGSQENNMLCFKDFFIAMTYLLSIPIPVIHSEYLAEDAS